MALYAIILLTKNAFDAIITAQTFDFLIERRNFPMAEKKKTESSKDSINKPKNAEEKKKALEAAIAHLEKQYGSGAVMRLGQSPQFEVDAIPTGSLTLDLALGIGGVPKGRIVEIYGPESSGKTTVALQIVAESQKQGGTAAFIDVEHALDPV